MIYDLKDALKKLINSRMTVLSLFIGLMFAIVFLRVFSLQIIHGDEYQENFTELINKTIPIEAARGNIYDCNGKLLAYNELCYDLVISDSGIYLSEKNKAASLNAELAEICSYLRSQKENLSSTFCISLTEDGSYEFNVSGSTLKRFLADVFGHSSVSELKFNKNYNIDEANATAEQVMNYLMDEKHFRVDASYSRQEAYDIVTYRYALSQIAFTRYKTVTMATDLAETSIAYLNEHADSFIGTSIHENYVRRYNDSVYFASMIGYTGRISTEEYNTLASEDNDYSTNDTVGKTGIEQYYESVLRGTKGETLVYTNNVGRITEVIGTTQPVAGKDIYLTIDSDLQVATYKLLEQEIASIVYSNILADNIKTDEVFFALINNNVIDISHFSKPDATSSEKLIFSAYENYASTVFASIQDELTTHPTALNDMSDTALDYFTYIISMLKENGIFRSSEISSSDEVYAQWKAGTISPKEYLSYAIAKQWIDNSLLRTDKKYADTEEIYLSLCEYIMEDITNDKNFSKLIYEYLIDIDAVTGREICMALLDQNIVDDENRRDFEALADASLSPRNFILDKINNLEITPAQLALDPCTGSCVITDPDTGNIKALVSYPGYDNNRLANGVDAAYYNMLREDSSNPLWNYATQEKTAPGSTYKMVTSTAALAENIITTDTKIECTGKFLEVDNEPECWIYPYTHGMDNVSEALRDSCNVFFYTMGYKMGTRANPEVFSDSEGISCLSQYASLYGLDRKTGIEIGESTPEIADQYPVMTAIGQSNNNFTTISLSRYVTAVTSGRLYDYKLLDHIANSEGEVLEVKEATSTDITATLNREEWNAIHYGMRMVCEDLDSFEGCDIPVAGKTGTAQQVENRPNHALFVGYAPYEDPEITIAVRISYGSSSHNAAYAARNILEYYFGEKTLDELIALHAAGIGSSSSNQVGD